METVNPLLDILGESLLPEERIILCGFRGDPQEVGPTAWRPRAWAPGRNFPFEAQDNVYATVSAFRKSTDGSFRRRADAFSAGLALMVDDVGTKVPRESVAGVLPTAIVETSPNNEQWWYVLEAPLRGEEALPKFDAVIRTFINSKLLGNDPGMNGVNRVGRLPGFLNGKAQYKGFQTQLREFRPERRFTIERLALDFGLDVAAAGRRSFEARGMVPTDVKEREAAFWHYFDRLKSSGVIKRDEFDPSGWIEIRCPWLQGHTKRSDTGAALRAPEKENGWYGAFRCHHGHCADFGWTDLTDWIADQDVEGMDAANRSKE